MGNFKKVIIENNYENKPRKFGFELEFSNIEIEDIAKILRDDFDLEQNKINSFLYKFDSKYGEFTLELDFELLTKQKLKKNIEDVLKLIDLEFKNEDIDSIEKFVGDLSKGIVPYEVSTPPLPFDKLYMIDDLAIKLKEHNAQGTKQKLHYAFGLHINIEVASLEVDSLLNYLKAFVILEDFINEDAEVDFVRKITPFIDKFKDDYIKHILDEQYNPTIEEFIDDYIKFNPTRNRSLDMLPILAFIDEKRVRGILKEEKIKPRPAFHYRLSNSNIGEEDWKVSDEWNRWILIEKLANDEVLLKELSSEYLDHLDNLINIKIWKQKVIKWL